MYYIHCMLMENFKYTENNTDSQPTIIDDQPTDSNISGSGSGSGDGSSPCTIVTHSFSYSVITSVGNTNAPSPRTAAEHQTAG